MKCKIVKGFAENIRSKTHFVVMNIVKDLIRVNACFNSKNKLFALKVVLLCFRQEKLVLNVLEIILIFLLLRFLLYLLLKSSLLVSHFLFFLNSPCVVCI